MNPSPDGIPIQPNAAQRDELATSVLGRLEAFIEGLDDRPAANNAGVPAALVEDMLAPPPEQPGDLERLLDRVDEAADFAIETAGPGFMGWIPAGGIYAAAIADLYSHVRNRYVGLAATSPGLAALEHGVVRWLAQSCGLPETAGGLLLSGGSTANLTAVVAARSDRLGEQIGDGTMYVTEQAHQSVAKAARIAGLPMANIRAVATTAELRMDIDELERLLTADREAGMRPFLVVGSAGTTNTGAIDPLPALAEIAAREGLWFHVDGAYGGLFMLTERGRERLVGIERADSVTLDPHKGMFLPYGTGAIVVRDPSKLHNAHAAEGHYLQDVAAQQGVPNFADLGPELTRDARGLRVWLPLHLHGVAAFRDALDEKLDLTAAARERLSREPDLEIPWEPELTVLALRMRARGDDVAALEASDRATRELLERINATRRVLLSSTVVEGRFTVRLCILSHRTHANRVTEAVEIVASAARLIEY